MTINTNIKPYFDDYDANKNFNKILFVPERAVQVREVNQLQSLIMSQIERFGNHVFENGSNVIAGEINYNLNYDYVKVTIPNLSNIADQLTNPTNTLVGQTSGINAKLLQFVTLTTDDPCTFYVHYTDAGTSQDEITFNVGEVLNIVNASADTIGTATVLEVGLGSNFTINEGVYYVNGYFVQNNEESIILDKYTNTPTYQVGFLVNEEVITENDDSSLYDNALGTPNASAPGAHRLKISLSLAKYASSDDIDVDNFIELFRISNGVLQSKARGVDYNILEDVLAKRTYDESGDYTIEPFGIRLREHLNDGTNDGLYDAPTGDDTKLVVGVEQGRAYVRGYEVSNLDTIYLDVDKARDTDTQNNAVLNLNFGYYVTIYTPNIIPEFNNFQEIEFYDNQITTPGVNPGGTLLGTANVRMIRRVAGVSTRFELFIFNVKDALGNQSTSFIKDVESVFATGTTYNFTADTWLPHTGNNTKIESGSLYPSVYKLPSSNIKTLLDGLGGSDITYNIIKQYNVTANGSGVVSINAASSETFVTQTSTVAYASTLDGTQTNIDISALYTLGGSPTGKTITIDFTGAYANREFRINLLLVKNEVLQKSKTSTNATVVGPLSSNILTLGKCDVYKINSILDASSNDITEQFKLESNRNLAFYDISYVQKIDKTSTISGNITVDFDYFAHGTGDYFSVDSYSGIDYADIPYESIDNESVCLSDVIDFRPRINDAGSAFTGTGSSLSVSFEPNSLLRADIEYYLPRIDKVYVSSNNEFGVIKGISSLNPIQPNDIDNAMSIYRLNVPAYTKTKDDVDINFINNKRYTMRDIGKLETRIENLEYYVSLNYLEKSTQDLEIIDSTTGLNRFKNGFVVDSFIDHSVGDFGWEEYTVAMDDINKLMRPQFTMDAIDLEYNSSLSSNVQKTGQLITLPYTQINYVNQSSATGTMNVNPYAVYRWVGQMKLVPASDNWIDTVYTNPEVTYKVFNNGKLTQQWSSWRTSWVGVASYGKSHVEETDSYIKTTNVDSKISKKVVNERVVDTSVSPHIRSKEVAFNASGLKPLSRVYPFFDNVNVSSYCKTTGSYGQALYTDSDGNISGTFKIPNTTSLKFRTGTRVFTLNDNVANNKETSQSYSDGIYTAKGIIETKKQNILTTQEIVTTTTTKYIDPLAQSFIVETDGGIFLTSIDLYFSSKDDIVPIKLQIRDMDNGYPSKNIVPYSEVSLNPSSVNVSTNGATATRFTFDSPVFLSQNSEYCFVVLSNSNNYNAYVAELGKKDLITKQYISKQPYIGVMFKSQNNSTWTADQTRDIKFKLNRAQFSSLAGSVVFNNKAPNAVILDNNPLYTTNASSTIKCKYKNHGFVVGTAFTLSNCTTGNNINDTTLNATHVVTAVNDYNEFEFIVSDVANASSYMGGSSIEITPTYSAGTINLNNETLELPQTKITWVARGTRGKSFSGTETPYQILSYNEKLLNKEDTDLKEPWLVCSTIDETTNLSSSKSLVVTGSLSTERNNISPCINLDRVGVILVNNQVNYVDVDTPDGADCFAKYRTNVVGLTEPANALKTFIDINQPIDTKTVISYRVGNTIDEVNVSDWLDLPLTSTSTIQRSDSFYEYEFSLDSIPDFTYYQIMIQIHSKTNNIVPKYKSFRTIALGT